MMNADQDNFESLFNAINDFLVILDLNGNIIEVNNAVVEILGYSKSELIGKNVLLAHPPEYRDKAKDIVGNIIAGTQETCPLPLLCKNGDYIPVETRIHRGTWNNEEVLIGVSRNLSKIAVSEEKFSRVFDNNQALMTISEVESGVFVNVNQVFLSTLGFQKSEILGSSSRKLNLFYDPKMGNELIEKVKSDLIVDNEYLTVQAKDGKLIHCLFSASIIKIQTYRYLLTSAIDISLLKQAEQKLKKSLKQQTLLADISQNLLSLDNYT